MIANNTKPQKPIKKLAYESRKTEGGTWKIFRDGRNRTYREFRSNAELFDLPLIHIAIGVNPETRKLGTANGILAIGNKARGCIAIGQFCQGYFAVGQFVTARVFGLGQFVIAPLAIGQLSLAVFGLGQLGVSLSGIYQLGVTFIGGIGQSILALT